MYYVVRSFMSQINFGWSLRTKFLREISLYRGSMSTNAPKLVVSMLFLTVDLLNEKQIKRLDVENWEV